MTGRICNVEALARWEDPKHGMIAPMELIQELEKADLIYELDMEILKQTCFFYNELKELGTPIHSFSVNLSRHDFKQKDLFDRISGILKEHNVSPDAINLEITESDMLDDADTFHKLFVQFTDAGFSFWIDDFGSGYSSLNMLKNYRFDVLKFDLQFLRDFSFKNRQILAPLTNMAKNLGIHTVAEGVENQEQHDFLISIGCEALQGFLFSRPLSKEKFIGYLEEHPMIVEPEEEKEYWNKTGSLNPLSDTPLESFNHDPLSENVKETESFIEAPLAIIEIGNNRVTHIYASNEYLKNIRELGYPSLEKLERAYNERISDQYLILKRMIMNAIGNDAVQELDYIRNNIYYSIRTRCLAKLPDKATIALQLTIFETENKTKTTDEIMRYSGALFATYEMAIIIHPKENYSERIFSRMGIQSYATMGGLRETVAIFIRNEVDERDQERYWSFLDLDTLEERVAREGFIQSFFRMKANGEWKSIRISKIPSDAEPMYLYTIQSILKEENDRMNEYLLDHPDL
jgi:EAL domain-containing protein (putative c-di-GMP-specific phosphodiesterase class I)